MLTKTILDDAHVRAVGRMILNFQALEWDIVVLIWTMSSDESVAQTKTAGKHFRELCDVLSSAFHDRVNAHSFVGAFDALISRARQINDDRNRVIHSWWFTGPVGEISRLKPKPKTSQFDSEDLDVNGIAISINTLIDDFAHFVDELSAAKLIKRPGIWLDSL